MPRATRRQAPVDHFAANEQRFNQARVVQSQIGDYAFGAGSRTTNLESGAVHRVAEAMASRPGEEDPGFAGMPPSAFRTNIGESAPQGLMPKARVLQHWEVPEHGKANSGQFMGASTPRQREAKFNERAAEVDAFHVKAGTQTAAMEHGGDVLGQSVDARLSHFSPDRDPDWYGPNGRAPQMIREAAGRVGISASWMRRGVSHLSPQQMWDMTLKSGPRKGQTVYPNLDAAVHMAKLVGPLNPQTADEALTIGRDSKIPFAATGDMKSKAARALSGHEDTSGTIVSDLHKVTSFDVALGDPNHRDSSPMYAKTSRGASWAKDLRKGGFGMSPLVARHVMDSHVGDTHDADALGIKESMVQHPTEKNPNGKPVKYGAISGIKNKPFHAQFLEKPSGYDLSVASNNIAASDAFTRDYEHHEQTLGTDAAELWARRHAMRYTVAASQSSQWTDLRGK